jgi:lysophospholipase L1-like esterase
MAASEPLGARKRLVFAAVTLLAPPALLLVTFEAVLRLLVPSDPPILRPGRSVAELLAESDRTEVSRATQGRFMGLIRPSPSKERVYELKPGRRWFSEDAPVRTNSRGFRGPELPETKPAGTIRIVGLGDSVMFGWGVSEDETYLCRLQNLLAAVAAGDRVEVLNLAVPGYNSSQEAAVLRDVALPLSPDLLLVGYVLNDAEPVLFRDEAAENPLVASSRLLQLARDLARDRLPGANVARDAMAAAVRDIGRRAKERGIPAIFFIYPNRVRGENPEAPRRIAEESGFLCVDLYAAFEAYYRRTGRAFDDVALSRTDAHPNPEGHRLMAEALLDPVRAALAAASKSRGQRRSD